MVDIRLTSEEEQELRALEPTIKSLKDTIARMKRIGVDVSAEEDALERAERLRKGFISEFGSRRAGRS